jgi:hypothetical protein
MLTNYGANMDFSDAELNEIAARVARKTRALELQELEKELDSKLKMLSAEVVHPGTSPQEPTKTKVKRKEVGAAILKTGSYPIYGHVRQDGAKLRYGFAVKDPADKSKAPRRTRPNDKQSSPEYQHVKNIFDTQQELFKKVAGSSKLNCFTWDTIEPIGFAHVRADIGKVASGKTPGGIESITNFQFTKKDIWSLRADDAAFVNDPFLKAQGYNPLLITEMRGLKDKILGRVGEIFYHINNPSDIWKNETDTKYASTNYVDFVRLNGRSVDVKTTKSYRLTINENKFTVGDLADEIVSYRMEFRNGSFICTQMGSITGKKAIELVKNNSHEVEACKDNDGVPYYKFEKSALTPPAK